MQMWCSHVCITHPNLPDRKSRTDGWTAWHPRYSACISPGKQKTALLTDCTLKHILCHNIQLWRAFLLSASNKSHNLPLIRSWWASMCGGDLDLAKHKKSQHNSPGPPWSSQTLLLLCRQQELPIPNHPREFRYSPRCRPPQCREQRYGHPGKNRKYRRMLMYFWGQNFVCLAFGLWEAKKWNRIDLAEYRFVEVLSHHLHTLVLSAWLEAKRLDSFLEAAGLFDCLR